MSDLEGYETKLVDRGDEIMQYLGRRAKQPIELFKFALPATF